MKLVRKLQNKNIEDRSLVADEKGLSTVEYIVLLALIVVVAITAWKQFGSKVNSEIDDANEAMKKL